MTTDLKTHDADALLAKLVAQKKPHSPSYGRIMEATQ
jgi:hypothetical protein